MSGATESTPTEVVEAGEVRIRRALLTVSDRRGLVDFARGLRELGVEIVSTGGTARELSEAGIETRPVEDYTRFPEILDGRVKTLNPRIYAGLLAVREKPEHVETLNDHEVEPIDLVCVNLYPFERVSSARGVSQEEVIENIDIGGPAPIPAAAEKKPYLPALYAQAFEKVLDLSYGENPHQRAAYYAQTGVRTHLLSMVSKLHGKELSFNNLLDLDSARRIVHEFEVPAAVIIKHNNPCGCAVGSGPLEAFEKALATDPVSAFGGVFCFNRPIGRDVAEKLNEIFVEVV